MMNLASAAVRSRRVLAVVFLVAAPGCTTYPARIHERFGELHPTRVRVAPVENRTLIDHLDRYPTAGFAQSVIFGPREVNLLAMFALSGRTVLEDRGYPLTTSRGEKADGELRIRIFKWQELPNYEGHGIESKIEVELVRLDSGEQLYHRMFSYRAGSPGYTSGPLTPTRLQQIVHATVKRSLGALPAYGMVEGS